MARVALWRRRAEVAHGDRRRSLAAKVVKVQPKEVVDSSSSSFVAIIGRRRLGQGPSFPPQRAVSGRRDKRSQRVRKVAR